MPRGSELKGSKAQTLRLAPTLITATPPDSFASRSLSLGGQRGRALRESPSPFLPTFQRLGRNRSAEGLSRSYSEDVTWNIGAQFSASCPSCSRVQTHAERVLPCRKKGRDSFTHWHVFDVERTCNRVVSLRANSLDCSGKGQHGSTQHGRRTSCAHPQPAEARKTTPSTIFKSEQHRCPAVNQTN